MKFSTFQKKRVVMATIGSLGDLHPYIALALEMKKRYIEPVIAAWQPHLFADRQGDWQLGAFGAWSSERSRLNSGPIK